jgi:chromosome segregation ATPase
LPKDIELDEKIKEFEEKIKLLKLLTDKKFADLELKQGEFEGKVNSISVDLPKIKERTAIIEDLLNIINLGIIHNNKKFDELVSRVSTMETLPKNIDKTMENYEKKLTELDTKINGISLQLNKMGTLKEELTKTFEDSISSNVKNLRETDESNKIDIEHLKKDIDAISSSIKSFERTIELTNLDDIIRRFDSLDKKTINTQAEVENLRNLMPSISLTSGDVEVLKKRVKEMSSNIMNSLDRINEFELNVNKKVSSIEGLLEKAQHLEAIEEISKNIKDDLNNFNASKADIQNISNDILNQVSVIKDVGKDIDSIKASDAELQKMINDNTLKLQSFNKEEMMDMVTAGRRKTDESIKRLETVWKRLDKIESKIGSSSEQTDKVEEKFKELLPEIKKIKLLQDEMERLWNTTVDLHRVLKGIKGNIDNFEEKSAKILQSWEDEIKTTRDKMSKMEDDMKSFTQLPANINQVFTDLSNRIKDLEVQNNQILCSYAKKEESTETAPVVEKLKELDILKSQVDGIKTSMISFNKVWSDYQRILDEKLRSIKMPDVRTGLPVNISQNAIEEINSLKDMINKLSADNEQIRRMASEIRINQLHSVTPDVFTSLSSKITSVEKKMGEIDREMSKLISSKPVVLE